MKGKRVMGITKFADGRQMAHGGPTKNFFRQKSLFYRLKPLIRPELQ
jgi:hypothetical protein